MTTLHLFRFENDVWPGLRRFPMAVRFKLDALALHLSLAQWQALSAAQRQLLLTSPFETADERARFAEQLREFEPDAGSVERDERDERHDRDDAAAPPRVADAPWRDPERLPEALAAECERQGVARVTAAEWRAFPEFGRYALTKLARPGHRNRGFVELLAELREPLRDRQA